MSQVPKVIAIGATAESTPGLVQMLHLYAKGHNLCAHLVVYF